jgi:hypothetical protein
MAAGRLIRRMFAPYERQISEAYRAAFFDMDAFVETMPQWAPNATKILEVAAAKELRPNGSTPPIPLPKSPPST